jgi:hypothetical protein
MNKAYIKRLQDEMLAGATIHPEGNRISAGAPAKL